MSGGQAEIRRITTDQYANLPWEQPEHTSRQIEQVAWVDDVTAAALGLEPANYAFVQFATKPGKPPSVYLYRDCPRPVVENIVSAESPGRMLNLAVKGVYAYEKVQIGEDES